MKINRWGIRDCSTGQNFELGTDLDFTLYRSCIHHLHRLGKHPSPAHERALFIHPDIRPAHSKQCQGSSATMPLAGLAVVEVEPLGREILALEPAQTHLLPPRFLEEVIRQRPHQAGSAQADSVEEARLSAPRSRPRALVHSQRLPAVALAETTQSQREVLEALEVATRRARGLVRPTLAEVSACDGGMRWKAA